MKKIFILLSALGCATMPLFGQLPDFTQTDCNGVSHHLYADLQAGNAVVLDFSAVWCAPCNQSAPVMEQLYKDFSSGSCKVKQYLMLFDGAIPNAGSDCTIGNKFAAKYHITSPVITNIGTAFTGLTAQFFQLYDQGGDGAGENDNGVPLFLVILPDVNDPGNSTVKRILGFSTDLENMIKDSLALGGFNPPPPITVTGTLCTEPPFSATLTSGFSLPNIWSTNETTPSIIIDHSGTYSVTKDGCSSSKYVEFTAPGLASISSNSVCEEGLYTLSYTVPPGSNGMVTWEYKDPDDNWVALAPGDVGPITLVAADPAGTIYTFRVRATNRTAVDGTEPCVQYSNEVELTITNSDPTLLEGTASASVNQTCYGTDYTISYSGGIANSIWEVYNDGWGMWLPLEFLIDDPWNIPNYFNGSYATAQPITVSGYNIMSSINGNPGNRFRVKSPDGNCYIFSNEVDVSVLPSPDASIIGPDFVCEGSNITLSVSGNFTSILWNTGATTPSIIVSPAAPTTYSVAVTDANSCKSTGTKDILVAPQLVPKINASLTSEVCSGSQVTLTFGGTYSIDPCINGTYGQFPANAFSFVSCDGINGELITDQAYSGQYSLVNVTQGNYYIFVAAAADFNIADDHALTVTSADGSQPYATGKNWVYYAAAATGQVRLYTTKMDCSADNTVPLVKFGICAPDLSAIGSLLWSTGQTTPSISVNPSATTSYTLTFTDAYTGCTYSSSQQIIVGIGASVLNTDVTCNSATLHWTAPFDPAQWQLQYKATAPGAKWVDIPLLTGSARSYVVSGLKPNQSYNWHIRAKCGKPWTDYSNAISFKTPQKCGSVTEARALPESIGSVSELQVKAMPNPTNSSFTIIVRGTNHGTDIKMVVIDVSGRVIEARMLPNEQTITLGDKYRPGVYIVRFIQGEESKQLKLIKLPD